MLRFLSTPSARRATCIVLGWLWQHNISIHALREEGDLPHINNIHVGINFYPRPPRGGRPVFLRQRGLDKGISIHALREEGDLIGLPQQTTGTPISIHALREEGDVHVGSASAGYGAISIHALREEGDDAATLTLRARVAFLSTPSARRATAKAEKKSSTFVLLYIFLHKLKRAFGKNADGTAPLLIDSFAFSVRSVPGNTVCLWFAQCRDQKINTLSCAKFGCRPTCSTLVW